MKVPEICEKIARTLRLEKRVIYRKGNEPYLTRYYILRKPRPWLPSIYLHCFHASDEDMELHNHPWSRSVSLILSGSYREEYRKGNEVRERVLSPGKLNYIRADDFHRVDLLSKNVWTLFISGSKVQEWGFWNRNTDEYVSWKEHERRKKERPNPYKDNPALVSALKYAQKRYERLYR